MLFFGNPDFLARDIIISYYHTKNRDLKPMGTRDKFGINLLQNLEIWKSGNKIWSWGDANDTSDGGIQQFR